MRSYTCLFLLILLSGMPSCRKALRNVDDYFPKVSILSAVVQADGSVKVTGNIDSPGYGELSGAGFCCQTHPQPELTDRQIISEDFNGTQFEVVYRDLDPDSIYYFRTWAINEYGYVYGTELSLTGIKPAPVFPPCRYPDNTLDMGTGNGPLSYQFISFPTSNGYTEFSASPQFGSSIRFIFNGPINPGVYPVVANQFPASKEVSVYFNSGFNTCYLDSGKVFMNALGADSLTVAICGGRWKTTPNTVTYTFYLYTRFNMRYKP